MVTFSLKGPHFSYDRTSSFSPSTQEHKGLLLGKGIQRNPVTETFVRAGKQDDDKEGAQTVELSLVDFQAENNIIDLRDGGVTVRFKLPCCFLGSRHRTGYICTLL